MNDNPNEPVSASDSVTLEAKQATLIARRRLLRGGLSVAPVLMAAAPRSVMAGGPGACVPASSFASINASRPDLQFTCAGRTPGYWKQEQWFGKWPAPYLPVAKGGFNATTFNSVFGSGYSANKTLLAVLAQEGNLANRDALARHIVAALLNAASGKTPGVLDVGRVKGIWSEFVAKGYYEPTAGIKWYWDSGVPVGTGSLEVWLKSTMPV